MTTFDETGHVQKLCDSIADAINQHETTTPYVITALELILFDYKMGIANHIDFAPEQQGSGVLELPSGESKE